MIEKINIMLLPILNLENFNQYNNGKIILPTRTRRPNPDQKNIE
ncbi:hypothetical protein PASm1_02220 [Pasteurella multocida]|nr:hypothetical protein PASm1_02220 [Pasteurella multocida]